MGIEVGQKVEFDLEDLLHQEILGAELCQQILEYRKTGPRSGTLTFTGYLPTATLQAVFDTLALSTESETTDATRTGTDQRTRSN